jgi:ubiquinone/menaquinone biosynthesis C-methylase UbiE
MVSDSDIGGVPLPPPHDRIHRHDVLPITNHDDNSRLNFIANLNAHIGSILFPGVTMAYEARVKPAYIRDTGKEPSTSIQVRNIIKKDPVYQIWAAVRRNTMEMRHQIGRSIALRQLSTIVKNAKSLNTGSKRLKLDSEVITPAYVSAADNHCMPGSYYSELVLDDVSGPANYEIGHYTTVAGGTGPKSDLIGRTMLLWLQQKYPDFKPKRIADFGASAGMNTLPFAEAFPRSNVYAVDVAAPMLRYGHARAITMGVKNVIFEQGNVETWGEDSGSYDLVISAMFFHETSTKAMRKVFRNAHRLLKPGGLMLHMEQPNFDPDTTAYEKFVRDWDCWYNSEPFWAKLHTMDFCDEMVAAGFRAEDTFETSQPMDRSNSAYPKWAGVFSRHAHEVKMREGSEKPNPKKSGGMYMFGAFKPEL